MFVDSDNLIRFLPMLLIFFAVSVLLDFCEYRARRKWIFLVANAICLTVVFAFFLAYGLYLSEMLLYLLMIIFARLCFIMFEGRRGA